MNGHCVKNLKTQDSGLKTKIALAAILLLAAVLRLQGIATPLHLAPRGHLWEAWKVGRWAGNILECGGPFAVGFLAPPFDTCKDVCTNHPPLVALWIAGATGLFGDSWAVMRLAILPFSLGIVLLVYLILQAVLESTIDNRQSAIERFALVGAALAAACPFLAYFGTLVDEAGPPVLFFSLLSAYAYALLLREKGSGGRRGLQTCALYGTFIAAALSNWTAFYGVAALLAHAAVFRRSLPRGLWATMKRFALLCVLSFVFLVFFYFAQGDPRLLWRFPAKVFGYRGGGDYLDDLGTAWSHASLLLTGPLLALAVLAYPLALRRSLAENGNRQSTIGNRKLLFLPFFLALPGPAHALLGPAGAAGHPYWIGPGVAGVVLMASVGLAGVFRIASKKSWRATTAALCLLLAVTLQAEIHWTVETWRAWRTDPAPAARILEAFRKARREGFSQAIVPFEADPRYSRMIPEIEKAGGLVAGPKERYTLPEREESETVSLAKALSSSFRRKPESSNSGNFWTPAFAGVRQNRIFARGALDYDYRKGRFFLRGRGLDLSRLVLYDRWDIYEFLAINEGVKIERERGGWVVSWPADGLTAPILDFLSRPASPAWPTYFIPDHVFEAPGSDRRLHRRAFNLGKTIREERRGEFTNGEFLKTTRARYITNSFPGADGPPLKGGSIRPPTRGRFPAGP